MPHSIRKERKRDADSMNTGMTHASMMDWERMLFCVLHHPMDAETTFHVENN
jgi:hypothetical protein